MPHRLVRSERFKQLFPVLVSELSFVEWSKRMLKPHGFWRANAIPCVSLCRDELTAPMMASIDHVWCNSESNSRSFVMSSLAGNLFLGKTGMAAAMSHAPAGPDGRTRYIFYAFPHIGINEKGEVGLLKRHGIAKDSTACGALCAFHRELQSGRVSDLSVDPDDIEYSLLRTKLMSKVNLFGKMPDLKDVTLMQHEVILEDLEKLIANQLAAQSHAHLADYAVFTGIQVHGPDMINAIAPRTCYAVVDGKRYEFALDEQTADEISHASPAAASPQGQSSSDYWPQASGESAKGEPMSHSTG